MKSEIIIKKLSETTLDDFLYFFDEVAFADNPEWAGCYCCYFHFEGTEEEWMKQTSEENRRTAIELSRHGHLQGFLAYVDGKPIGWCNVNRKHEFVQLKQNPELLFKDDPNIISITCFTVAPGFRRQGVADRLLKFIIDYYTYRDFQVLEAYPIRVAKSDAEHYHGPVSLFKNHGFEEFKTTNEFIVVRKQLS